MNENSNPRRLVRLAALAGGGTAAAGVALTAALTIGVSHTADAAKTTTTGTTSDTSTSSTTSGDSSSSTSSGDSSSTTTNSGTDSTGGLSNSTQNQSSDAGSNGS